MNWHSTAVLTFPKMLSFLFHPRFEKEAAKIKRRLSYFDDGLESFKRICEFQFDPINPKQVVAPAKLHRIKCFDNFIIWKIELAVRNVRSNQSPRIWFAVRGATVAFLCAACHVDNYDDNVMDREAAALAGTFFS